MNTSHDFQFKIQNKIITTLFELNNHVTIFKFKIQTRRKSYHKIYPQKMPTI